MIPLIRTDDRIELVISTDPSVKLSKSKRQPARLIPKSEASFNDGTPLVITIRPLNSIETLRMMGADGTVTHEATIESCKAAVVRVDGDWPGISLPITEITEETLGTLPPIAIVLCGNYIVAQSVGVENPT
mgnify:CR=1 FL=1